MVNTEDLIYMASVFDSRIANSVLHLTSPQALQAIIAKAKILGEQATPDAGEVSAIQNRVAGLKPLVSPVNDDVHTLLVEAETLAGAL